MKNPDNIARQLMKCEVCGEFTPHHNAPHHSGEMLAQCKMCHTFKPYLVPRPPRRKLNPVPPSSRAGKGHRAPRGEVEKARLLYEKFTGHDADEEVTIDKPPFPDVLSVIGDIDALLYTTVRDGNVERYKHTFKKNSRPLFCVSPDGLSLHLIGGSYEFGERGIVDKD